MAPGHALAWRVENEERGLALREGGWRRGDGGALTQDQGTELLALNRARDLGVKAFTFDGDTPGDARLLLGRALDSGVGFCRHQARFDPSRPTLQGRRETVGKPVGAKVLQAFQHRRQVLDRAVGQVDGALAQLGEVQADGLAQALPVTRHYRVRPVLTADRHRHVLRQLWPMGQRQQVVGGGKAQGAVLAV